MDFPPSRMSATTSALYSFEKLSRDRFAMTHSHRTFVRCHVSTKPGQLQVNEVPRKLGDGPPPRETAIMAEHSQREETVS